jgi:hypothetical protein
VIEADRTLFRSKIMTKHTAILFLSGLLMAGGATAETRVVRGLEQAIESTTASLNLPDKLPGSIAIAPCNEGCAPLRLEITENSRFFLGRKAVPFGELKKMSDQTGINVAVFYEPNSKIITRIILSDRMH